MPFSSQIGKFEPIINDESPDRDWDSADLDHGRGLRLEMRGPSDFEYGEYAAPFPQELLIPQSEWEPRIKEMEEQKSRISDLIRLKKLPHKDQGQTNYCWINAPVHCVEILRLQQNQSMRILSPASAGALIKNFRNVGGWGKEGLEFLVKNGCNAIEDWPANAIDRSYATSANRQKALDNRAVEWIECRPRTIAQKMSLLLRGYPGAGGYNWWRHEVNICDPCWIDNAPATRIRNSWRGWGDFGFGILQGQKMLADDVVFVISARPN